MKSILLLTANIVFIIQLLISSILLYLQLTSDGSMGGFGAFLMLFLGGIGLTILFAMLSFIVFITKVQTNLLFRIAIAANALLVIVLWYITVF